VAPKLEFDRVEAARFSGFVEKAQFKNALSDLGHRNSAVRAVAVKALSKIDHELSVRAIVVHFSGEPAAEVRKECVNALATLGLNEAIPVVEHALNDSAANVRLAATMGIYRLAGAAGASTIIGMLNDESVEVRRMVACCTGWMGQARMAVELIPLLSDEEARVRRAAVEAMGCLGDRGVVSALIERLNDADESARKKVFEAVEKITGKRMGKRYPENEEERARAIARWRHWWKWQATI